MEKKRFLITGITGHLGPHLANILLENNYEVWGLHRRTNGGQYEIADVMGGRVDEVKFIYGDLTDFHGINKIFQTHEFTGVFHCGAQSNPPISFEEPLMTMNVNIMGTANLIQAIIDNQPDCILLFVSSSEVYGGTIKDNERIKEDASLQAANPYSLTKISSDLYIQERIRNGFLKGIITRAFSHLCPRRGKNFSISSDAYNLSLIALGRTDKVLKVGNLDTVRVVIDGRDVAAAYVKLMLEPRAIGGVFNVAGETPHPMRFYTDKLIEIAGYKVEEIKKEIYQPYWRPHDIFVQQGDCSKLRETIDWVPKIPIEQTLTQVFDYWMHKLS